MRICIFGAGAVGSHFAVRLALAGHEVSCVMRGPHLEATKSKGLTLRSGDAELTARVKASDDPARLGPQDIVISTLKATGLGSLATGLRPLLRDDTSVLFAQNGIPWWYDLGLSDHPPPPDLGFLDPGGALRAAIAKERIIGGVIFSSNEITAPGVVTNFSPDRNMLLIGECDDRATERIERLRATLNEAAIDSTPTPRIREAIWSKLLTNMSMSILCLLDRTNREECPGRPGVARRRAALARRSPGGGTKLLPRRQADCAHRCGARAQAFHPAGLRAWPGDGDRRAGARARSVCPCRGTVDADAGFAGGPCDPPGARQGALSGVSGLLAFARSCRSPDVHLSPCGRGDSPPLPQYRANASIQLNFLSADEQISSVDPQ